MAKRRRPNVTLIETAAKIERRFAEVEALSHENKRILDLQFKRMAAIQVDIDRLLAFMKGNG